MANAAAINFDSDPIFQNLDPNDERHLQLHIERMFLYASGETRWIGLNRLEKLELDLRRLILLANSDSLDKEDKGGLSTDTIFELLDENGPLKGKKEHKLEYKQPMCVYWRDYYGLFYV